MRKLLLVGIMLMVNGPAFAADKNFVCDAMDHQSRAWVTVEDGNSVIRVKVDDSEMYRYPITGGGSEAKTFVDGIFNTKESKLIMDAAGSRYWICKPDSTPAIGRSVFVPNRGPRLKNVCLMRWHTCHRVSSSMVGFHSICEVLAADKGAEMMGRVPFTS
jgi:hypothetical protein